MHTKTLVALAALTLAAMPAWTEVPFYEELQLQARANFSGAYNLPDATFFTSETPRINGLSEVAIKVLLPTTDPGVWFGGNGAGSVVYTAPAGSFLSGVTLNDAAMIVFAITFYTPDGLYFYDTQTTASGIETDQPLGADGWGSPQLNTAGQIGYRAGFSSDHAWVSWDGAAVATHAAEVAVDIGSPYAYLFTPSFNDSRQIAGKVSLVAGGDQIRLFASDGSSTLIAEDQTSNPLSPFASFSGRNSVSLTDTGWVAFVAEHDQGHDGVYFSDGVTTVEIGSTAAPEISAIEFFAPAANNPDLVAFRAVDAAGLQVVYVGDGNRLVRVVSEHDLVPTDLGLARIDQHDDSYSVFGGSPTINDAGDVALNASLTPADNNQVEWGSGIFVAVATLPIFADGFESGDTSEWDTTVP